MNIQHITVAGSGVLGSQIAFQSAFFGYDVIVYDISDDILQKAQARFAQLRDIYAAYFNDAKKADDALTRLQYHSNLQQAVAHADLVIEAIPEVPAIKEDFYTKLRAVAPAHTIFASNSSTLLPSQFAQFTGRPETFLALHFANEI